MNQAQDTLDLGDIGLAAGNDATREPEPFTREQSAQAVRLYTAFRHALDRREVGGRFMPYRWWTLPDPLEIVWMPYSKMLSDFASDLANIINALTQDVHRLRAWAQLSAGLDDHEKLVVSHEFVDTLGTVALGRPYAIKSRFAFAAGHLSHQANQARDLDNWRDDFPDERALYLNDIEPVCAGWRKYRRFKLQVEKIAGSSFRQASEDFRHAYNHRFPARLLIGMSATVTRDIAEDGAVSYSIGGTEPLNLDAMAALLAGERDQCYKAFAAFQALVEEQTQAIAASSEKRSSPED